MSQEQTATATAAPVIVEPSSPKLDELKLKRKVLWAEMVKIEDPDSQAAKDASLAVWKIDGEIRAEKSAIIEAEKQAKIIEARNQRLQLVTNLTDAHAALLSAKADKKADPAKVAELEATFKTAKEVVENELIAKYATSRPAKMSAENGEHKQRGSSAERDAKLWPLFAAGKTAKEVEIETGENRSNVWFSLDRYRKANQVPA